MVGARSDIAPAAAAMPQRRRRRRRDLLEQVRRHAPEQEKSLAARPAKELEGVRLMSCIPAAARGSLDVGANSAIEHDEVELATLAPRPRKA